MSAQTLVLITGANSGIGFSTAKVIAGASPNFHVLLAGRNPAKVKKAVADIQSLPQTKGTLSELELDINDDASIQRAAKLVQEKYGHLDVLVNNAGIAVLPDGASLKDQLEGMLKTNTIGPVLLTDALKPSLLQAKNPYSIYVTSGLGSLAMATDPHAVSYPVPYTVYRASKAALNMLVIQEHKEMAQKGLKSFVVCPGLVRSNLRGTAEEAISAGGIAGDPDVSGNTILGIIQGQRDGDVGKFVHKDGIYPW